MYILEESTISEKIVLDAGQELLTDSKRSIAMMQCLIKYRIRLTQEITTLG
jgi:hypothetical protein